MRDGDGSPVFTGGAPTLQVVLDATIVRIRAE
jgi:hypothetical protein